MFRGTPVGSDIIDETVCRMGTSFHFTGRVIWVDAIYVGGGNLSRKVSWRNARIRKKADTQSTAKRRTRKPIMDGWTRLALVYH
jgi:hypothetical protein